MYTLTTLHRFRHLLGFAPADTADDRRLLHALNASAAHIERATGRRFVPRHAALAHTARGGEVILTDDLLEPVSVVDTVGSIPLAELEWLPDTAGAMPYSIVRARAGRAFVGAVTITGVWGWHDQWANAWRGANDALALALDATAATVRVTAVNGADAHGETPRFQVGQLVRVNGEYLRVLATDATANTLTVQRGAAGSTRAAHALGSPIAVYQPPADVEQIALRWAAWLYRLPDLPRDDHAPNALLDALAGLGRIRV